MWTCGLAHTNPTTIADGNVILNKEDLDQLGVESEKLDSVEDITVTVRDNLTLDQAIQINGPIGKEGFIKPRHTEILNNVASGQSCQINYAVSVERWNEALNHQEAVVDSIFTKGKLSGEQIVEILKAQNEAAHRNYDRVREGRVQRSEGQSDQH